jgi:hypothetical protein
MICGRRGAECGSLTELPAKPSASELRALPIVAGLFNRLAASISLSPKRRERGGAAPLGPRTRAGGATKQRPRGASPGAVTPDRRLLKRTTRSGVGRVNGDNRERVSPGQNPVPARACVRWSALSCFVTEGFRQRIRWHRQEVPAHVAARTPSGSRARCWLGRDRDARMRAGQDHARRPDSSLPQPQRRVAAGVACLVRHATDSSLAIHQGGSAVLRGSAHIQVVPPWHRPNSGPSCWRFHLSTARVRAATGGVEGQSHFE